MPDLLLGGDLTESVYGGSDDSLGNALDAPELPTFLPRADGEEVGGWRPVHSDGPIRWKRGCGTMNPGDRNVLAIKWGSSYDANYVNRLYAMARRRLTESFRFVCLTDQVEGLLPEIESRPIPDLGLPESAGRMAWPKLSVFHPSLGDLRGTCLFLDLDVVLVDRIDELFEFQPGRFCLIQDWVQSHRRWIAARPNVGNSSIFRFDAGTMDYIVDYFVPNQARIMNDFRNEQRFLTHMVKDSLAWWPTPWVVSFKRHCIPTFPLNLVRAPTVPEGAKVVAFHGTPKPDQVEQGYRQGWYRRTLPAAWIAENWKVD